MNKVARAPRRPFMSVGVRSKLLLSFSLVVLTTIAASSLAFFSFEQIERSLGRITQDSMPRMTNAMLLAQSTAALVTTMPLLMKSNSQRERENLFTNLTTKITEIQSQGSGVFVDAEMATMVERLANSVLELNSVARQALESEVELSSSAKIMHTTHRELDTLLKNKIAIAELDVLLQSDNLIKQNEQSLDNLINLSLVRLHAALSLKAHVNQLVLSMNLALSSSNIREISRLEEQSAATVTKIVEYKNLMDGSLIDMGTAVALDGLVVSGSGPNSLFTKRKQAVLSGMGGSVAPKIIEKSLLAQAQVNRKITELIENEYQSLAKTASSVVEETTSAVEQLIDKDLADLRVLTNIREKNNMMLRILMQTIDAKENETLKSLRDNFLSIVWLDKDGDNTLLNAQKDSDLRPLMQTMQNYGHNKNNIFNLKEKQLDSFSNSELILSKENTEFHRFLEIVNSQVDGSRDAVVTASVDTNDIINSSKLWLGVFVATSLCITILVIWLLVSKHLLGRLLEAISALHKLSTGDLGSSLEVRGNDEITDLAKIVSVFRDSALEKQRLQKSEKQAMQERIEQESDKQRLKLERQTAIQEKQQQELELFKKEKEQADALKHDTDALLKVVVEAAKGNLMQNINIPITGNHPTGQLAKGLELLMQSISSAMNEISNSAECVASGSSEIARGNQHLAERTEKQTLSLLQTTKSMQEMTTTVEQNTSNAQHANELAASAQERAEKGSQVVTDAVAAMSDINESSAKISDIVNVIDEIAFQTNLLALNAAVEAARAGEQGRGFAVVASEVRNLAARSAVAAKEIGDLIDDSVEKVNHGVRLVGDSGATLKELLDSVEYVAKIVRDIASASEQQSAGIQRVNQAINLLDETNRQNVALVDLAAKSSDTMASQSVKLKEQVSFFTFEAQPWSANENDTQPREQLPEKLAR